jgi:hypothetical protein
MSKRNNNMRYEIVRIANRLFIGKSFFLPGGSVQNL